MRLIKAVVTYLMPNCPNRSTEEEEYVHLFQPPRADQDGSPPLWKWSKQSAMKCATDTTQHGLVL
jgi:hypothetical protein